MHKEKFTFKKKCGPFLPFAFIRFQPIDFKIWNSVWNSMRHL